MSPTEIYQLIMESKGRPFRIRFLKRRTNVLRELPAKTEVRIDGVPTQGRDNDGYALVNVYDTDVGRYKSIPIEGLRGISFDNGVSWLSVDG